MTKEPKQAADLSELSGLAPKVAMTFATIASDIALVIDEQGIIRNMSFGSATTPAIASDWVGRAWVDTVTTETRGKIEQLLQEVSATGVSTRRQVNHPAAAGGDVPMTYAAIRLGEGGPVLAAGRDMRAIAAIQQRFIDSQREMERDYWKTRQAESRYRMLFQVATDAVLVVDALSLRVLDANRAACGLFDLALEGLVGHPATSGIDPYSRSAIEDLFAIARSTGRPAEIRARLAANRSPINVSATPLRTENAMLLLVRARAIESALLSSEEDATLAGFVERTPDAVVITDSSGRVMMSNAAFAELCHRADESQLRGRLLSESLGDPGARLQQVLGEARRNGIATAVGAAITVGSGQDVALDISAALLAEGDQECIGFTMRRSGPRASEIAGRVRELHEAMTQLASLVGKGSLPEILGEVAHFAERHMIVAALEQAGGDRAAAAASLGVTAENLGLRMRRLRLDVETVVPRPPRSLAN